LLTQGTNVYTWDAANRLVSANVDGVVSSFEYDGSGNRTAQTVGGVTTEYVLDVRGGLPEVIVATTGGAGAGSNPGGVRRRGVGVRAAGSLACICSGSLGPAQARTGGLGAHRDGYTGPDDDLLQL
jgi:YD repeat-containing protein